MSDAFLVKLQAEWKWCAKHGDPIQVFSDGSQQCVHDLVVEAVSDDHVVVEWQRVSFIEVGIDYCTVHHGTRNEDESGNCDWRMRPPIDARGRRLCVFRPLGYQDTPQ